jgi:hypothetical protein
VISVAGNCMMPSKSIASASNAWDPLIGNADEHLNERDVDYA